MIFDRQILYWGEEKQEKIRKSTVLVAGVGGLGSFISQILVRAGVGKLYIVDNGIIDEPDLNRQILYNESDVGEKKVFIAEKKLKSIHNFTDIVPIFNSVSDEFSIPDDVNAVADCLDNFEGRKNLNNVLKKGQIEVHIAVERNYGQIITLKKGESPDLSELESNFIRYDKIIPVSADSVGVMASLGANEVINCISSQCALLNTLLFFELDSFTVKKIKIV